jgi:hypothetical protein
MSKPIQEQLEAAVVKAVERTTFQVGVGVPLRDWFAGQALAGMLANSNADWDWPSNARDAYEVADAMLRARGGEKERGDG